MPASNCVCISSVLAGYAKYGFVEYWMDLPPDAMGENTKLGERRSAVDLR